MLLGGADERRGEFAARHFSSYPLLTKVVQRQGRVKAPLRSRRLTIVSLQEATDIGLRQLVTLAQEFHAFAIAIVLPGNGSPQRRKQRLTRIGFRKAYDVPSLSSGKRVSVRLYPTWPDRRHLSGPFDIIGDVHGCASELLALLDQLNYDISYLPDKGLGRSYFIIPPAGRTAVFVGDLCGAGPRNEDVFITGRRIAPVAIVTSLLVAAQARR
ncbi:MAG: hypothetical protein AAGC70_12725 [Pseudomonadota bacterium]